MGDHQTSTNRHCVTIPWPDNTADALLSLGSWRQLIDLMRSRFISIIRVTKRRDGFSTYVKLK